MAIKGINKERMMGADYDLFCVINNIPIHIATMGSQIPSFLNDKQRISMDLDLVSRMPASFEVELNLGRIKELISDEVNYSYLQIVDKNMLLSEVINLPSFNWFSNDIPVFVKLFSWYFVEMARRGFYSFAHYGDVDSDSFFLVAWPKQINQSFIDSYKDRSFLFKDLDLNNPEEIKIIHFERLFNNQRNDEFGASK